MLLIVEIGLDRIEVVSCFYSLNQDDASVESDWMRDSLQLISRSNNISFNINLSLSDPKYQIDL